MRREGLRVDGRGGDEQLQIGALRQQRAQVAQQEVDVQRALVRLIQDDHRIRAQQRIALNLREQNAIGHELHARVAARVVIEAHLAAHLAAPLHAEFFRDALRHTHRRYTTRLRAADLPAQVFARRFEAHLGQLRRLPRSRLARQDHHLMIANGRHDLLTAGRDGQVGRVLNGGHL